MVMLLQRGDVVWVNLDPTVGTEIKKKRPCIIISNDAANKRYHQVTVIPLTSQRLQDIPPFQVYLTKTDSGLEKDSKALAEQLRTVSKLRIGRKISHLSTESMSLIDAAIKLHLSLE